MYTRLNYIKGNNYGTILNPYIVKFENEFKSTKDKVKNDLKEFILDNGHIDASNLQKKWFPIINADVFISHSHQDIHIAKALAGWLRDNFGLNSFIDSYVWGYCDDLLKLIDNEYCKHENKETYDYTLRNYTTSHVHTLLSSAISQMIDKTECVIFINTPQSVTLRSEIDSIKETSITTSPWIYHELSMTSIIKTTKPIRRKKVQEHFQHGEIRELIPEYEYKIDKYLDGMTKLTEDDLTTWLKNNIIKGSGSLDKLYELKNL